MDDEVRGWLRDPRDGSALTQADENRVSFAGGHSYPVHKGTPILLVEERSLFNSAQITGNVPTTEIVEHGRFGRMKVYLRHHVLPSLSFDHRLSERRRALARLLSPGPVLILGAGRRGDVYRDLFEDHKVVVTDVHCQYGVDFVIDAHDIPFPDNTFCLVLAAQVLEHTARPWRVAEEMQRVTKPGGCIQIEVPFVHPYHLAPYDFFRFTPSALRFLFRECALTHLDQPEGRWSGCAVALSQALVDCFSRRYARGASVVLARLSLWWMKYLDRLVPTKKLNMPKGFVATYHFDGMARSDQDLLKEVQLLTNF